MSSLARRLTERAHELGFVAVGYSPVAPLDHATHLEQWLADGFHGEMDWMVTSAAARQDPNTVLAGVRTVISLVAAYGPPDVLREATDGPSRRAAAQEADTHVAAYAAGPDYHGVLRQRVQQLAAFLRAEGGGEVSTRSAVDSAPILERAWAIQAGVGWLGKSAMVLSPEHGSYLFLAELLTDLELGGPTSPQPDRCGRCTRCIDACPTGAIVGPYRVDARRCISYLTIEVRGAIPRPLRRAIGLRLFGCDVCQAVCPWNVDAHPTRLWEAGPSLPLHEEVHRVPTDLAGVARLLHVGPRVFNRGAGTTPLARPKRRGLARNAAVVLGNSGDRRWVVDLVAALRGHDEPLVRGHAAWALGQLGGAMARVALGVARTAETDDDVLEEIRDALACLD